MQLEPTGPVRPDTWLGASSPAYWNMVGPFGGTTAATAVQAIMQHPAGQGAGVSKWLFYQTAHVWNEAGLLLATSTQMVYYKE